VDLDKTGKYRMVQMIGRRQNDGKKYFRIPFATPHPSIRTQTEPPQWLTMRKIPAYAKE
jgi:hypothetical protein